MGDKPLAITQMFSHLDSRSPVFVLGSGRGKRREAEETNSREEERRRVGNKEKEGRRRQEEMIHLFFLSEDSCKPLGLFVFI